MLFFPYRYEGLANKNILQFLDDSYPHVYDYLPERKIELPKVPKQWFVNVCATILEGRFSNWVKDRSDYRHENLIKKQNQTIEMDKEMYEKFKQSKAISSKCLFSIMLPTVPILIFAQFEIDCFVVAATKGVSSKLLKVGNKRRRTKQEIADQLEAEEREKRASKAKI